MGRSRTGGRRPAAPPAPRDPLAPRSSEGRLSPAPSLAAATVPRVWQGIGYRPLPDAAAAHPLFDFAAVPRPGGRVHLAWGAYAATGAGERLVGAVLAEGAGTTILLHGPVVAAEDDPLEVAAQLVAAALDHATALGAETVWSRPLGLDRVWVRFGFIPVPEGTLPAELAGRVGVGLYAWRGGSALWSLRGSASG